MKNLTLVFNRRAKRETRAQTAFHGNGPSITVSTGERNSKNRNTC